MKSIFAGFVASSVLVLSGCTVEVKPISAISDATEKARAEAQERERRKAFDSLVIGDPGGTIKNFKDR